MLPFRHPISGNAPALLALSFRPVTANHIVPGYTWNCSLCVMPGTRKKPRHAGTGLFKTTATAPDSSPFVRENVFIS
jgi:hypothetical protein